MRRKFVRSLAILILVVATAVPASAAPRRDDGSGGLSLFERIVQIIKHIVSPRPTENPTFPIP